MIKLIAEIGINHNGSIDDAKKLIDVASIAGFDYVKFQKRAPDICVPESQKLKPKSTPWGEMSYIDYKHRIEFSIDQYRYLSSYSKSKGIEMFASVWDQQSATYMASIMSIVKIPSALITDRNLLIACRKLYEYVIISTGMSTEKEIEIAVELGKPDCIMHTNSSYPAAVEELNLDYITWLRRKYPKIEIGYSGHEFGLTTTYAASVMGVSWIERHVTLDHNLWGSDQSSSIDIVGMIKLVRGIRDIEKARGGYEERHVLESEKSKREALRKC